MSDEQPVESKAAPPVKTVNTSTKKAKTQKSTKLKQAKKQPSVPKAAVKKRPFPMFELQEAIKVPMSIKEKNGGHPWDPELIRQAVNYPTTKNKFYYLTASSRDYGLTEGSSTTEIISLSELGKRLVYAQTPEVEQATRREAFFNVPIFKQVLEHYKDALLPEMKYLGNALETKYHLHPSVHQDFADLFRKNCEYLGITKGGSDDQSPNRVIGAKEAIVAVGSDFLTVAEPEKDTGLVCFVAMPFEERHDEHQKGFFAEVLRQIIAPAGRAAGFRVITARKQGSDVIQATIINGLLDSSLVLVDLTEHNPNVLFELGVRMAEDKPVVLIRAMGTKPIFDVDHLLRVEDYNPCLWPSTVEVDLPKITAHIKGAWDSRENAQTYMKILRNKTPSDIRKAE